MEQQITNYAFNKTNKTVTFLDYSTIKLESIKSIINVANGIVLYHPGNVTRGGTVINNVLTLAYDTSAMNDTDALSIIYESEETPSSAQNQLEIIAITQLLKRMVKLMESQGVVDIQTRQRVVVDNVTSVLPSTYSIGSALGNTPSGTAPANGTTVYYQPVWSGPIDPRWTNIQNARIAYNTGIRSKLINS